MSQAIARVYIACWSLAIALAVVLAIAEFRRPGDRWVLFRSDYFRWLFSPWKLATFAVAFVGMVIVAPYSGDPTWDYVTGGVQSVMTFLTAPWSVGTLYRRVRRVVPVRGAEVYGACIAWLVSVSWFYDGYLTWRDGHYPHIWAENLFASSALYLLAGSLWSIGPADKGIFGATLAFIERQWPAIHRRTSRGVLVFAFVVMLFTTVMMAPFLVQAWEAYFR